MGKEFNEDFEQFMTNEIATQKSPIGYIVKCYLESLMVIKQRTGMPIFPGSKDWVTYEVRNSDNGIFDDGWAHIRSES